MTADSSLQIRILNACRCFAGSHKKRAVTHWSYGGLLASPRADLRMYPRPQLFVISPPGTPAISIGLESLTFFSASGLCLRRLLPVIDSAKLEGKTPSFSWLRLPSVSLVRLSARDFTTDTSAHLLSEFNQVFFSSSHAINISHPTLNAE